MDIRKMTRDFRLSQWAEVIRAKNESGKTVSAYCEAAGISSKKLYYYQKLLREQACDEMSNHNQTINELTAPVFTRIGTYPGRQAYNVPVTVRIGNHAVEIQNGADNELINRILHIVTQL